MSILTADSDNSLYISIIKSLEQTPRIAIERSKDGCFKALGVAKIVSGKIDQLLSPSIGYESAWLTDQVI